jgi:uncharacterized membrane protein YkvA (DUF1232 family)
MGFKTNLLKKVLTSKSFLKATARAAKMLKEEKNLSTLASEALEKIKDKGGIKTIGLEAVNKVKVSSSMIYHYATGRYVHIKPKSIMIIIAVLFYFIMPIDLMPDFIPGLGLLDDITLLGWVFNTLSKEIKEYEVWYDKYKQAEGIDFIELD